MKVDRNIRLTLVSLLVLGICGAFPATAAWHRDTDLLTIQPNARYLFYLHGKIVEEQGMQAVSLQYGKYDYVGIIRRFVDLGYEVISEPRLMNTGVPEYAMKVVGQIQAMRAAGVPARNITVVGASKGAAIATMVSRYLREKDINYVLLAGCANEPKPAKGEQKSCLCGNILSIYDSLDVQAGSCRYLVEQCDQKRIPRFRELILYLGLGHGFIYQPLEDWIQPVVDWSRGREPAEPLPPMDLLRSNLSEATAVLSVSVGEIHPDETFHADNGTIGYLRYSVTGQIDSVFRGNFRAGEIITYYFTQEYDPGNPLPFPRIRDTLIVFLRESPEGKYWPVGEAAQFRSTPGLEKTIQNIAATVSPPGPVTPAEPGR